MHPRRQVEETYASLDLAVIRSEMSRLKPCQIK